MTATALALYFKANKMAIGKQNIKTRGVGAFSCMYGT